MGMLFNTLNALMQGGWIFYISPADYYEGWFSKPYFYIGAALFVAGMVINLHSDYIIRHLRKPAIHAITFPGAVCSATFRRPTISES